jgi:hypothetical protein
MVTPVYARPSDDGDGSPHYIYDSRPYVRMTEYLSVAKSDLIGPWMGKMAALRAASYLVHAGLATPDCETNTGLALEEFVDAEAIRVVDAPDAVRRIMDWSFVMREGFRYRDHKSRVGRVVHHANYQYAMTPGDCMRWTDEQWLDWMRWKARKLQLITPEIVSRYEEFGTEKGLEDIELDLAHHSLPYVRQKIAWNEQFLPDWEMIGLDLAVFTDDDEGNPLYAGTTDEMYWLSKANFERAGRHWPFPDRDRAFILSDDKTTNVARHKSHPMQVAGYARAGFIYDFVEKSVIDMPEFHGVAISYMLPKKDQLDYWLFVGEDTIDQLFEGTCLCIDLWRFMHDMPRASRKRKFTPPKPKKGARPCPITIGGINNGKSD